MTLKTPPLIKIWLVRLLLLAGMLVVATLIGFCTYLVVRLVMGANSQAFVGQGPQIVAPTSIPQPGITDSSLPTKTSEPAVAPLSQPTLTPWDGAGRVTMLILGLDYRDWEQGSQASRSDTMILLTLDPLTRTAGILSIPRDTWVAIPGFTHAKINTAYYLGEAHKLPGGGPGLAVKTVEQFLGVPINYYAQIDFDAFVRFIDEIGGVKINVPAEITIDLLGDGANTIKTLKPGPQVLPGEWALAYARNRKTSEGDFDRARRQQQVVLAIRNRILSLEALPLLIQKAPVLYQELATGIHTNMSLEQAIRLALLAQQVPEGNIKQGVLGKEYIIFGRSPDNLSINIPIPDKVNLLRDEIFATSGALGPLTPGSPSEQMAAEVARMAVYNGSRDPDLGERFARYMSEQSAQISQVGEAQQRYTLTTLIDHSGNPYTIKYLASLLGVRPSRIILDYAPENRLSVEVYLGYDAEGISLP